jgi:hypothetical protein
VIDVHRHREDVVRRLLDRGLSAAVLAQLVPEWHPLIDRVAATDGPRVTS